MSNIELSRPIPDGLLTDLANDELSYDDFDRDYGLSDDEVRDLYGDMVDAGIPVIEKEGEEGELVYTADFEYEEEVVDDVDEEEFLEEEPEDEEEDYGFLDAVIDVFSTIGKIMSERYSDEPQEPEEEVLEEEEQYFEPGYEINVFNNPTNVYLGDQQYTFEGDDPLVLLGGLDEEKELEDVAEESLEP